MTLRHKNTSKWIRRQLVHREGQSADTRAAVARPHAPLLALLRLLPQSPSTSFLEPAPDCLPLPPTLARYRSFAVLVSSVPRVFV